MALKARSITSAACSSRRGAVVVRASASKPSKQVDLRAALVATAASLLLMAGGAGAKPIRLAEKSASQAEQVEQQMAVMEYALRQQQTARQAELAAQQQQLSKQLVAVEDQIQKKITEEKAAVASAAAAGDTQAVAALTATEAQLEAKAEEVAVTAAKIGATIGRAEMLEKVKYAAAEQQLEKGAAEAVAAL